ncbi:hypothetical protein [Xylanibacter ruminicola]|uniref:Uncharacterized protein n=1 Tax=Xylanibacter ruminicola TaxID=839 RepID=A0A1M6VWE9_XYLRU|nr:hypothetical protein [Xylanibacter ruminicola]SHK85698.1 hypothetical protein SAMN05216463_11452 [Xylanibacter ruminicola]
MSEEFLNQNETVQCETKLIVTESMKADLLCAAKWAKFLCILGCVGVALLVIVAFLMMFVGAVASKLLDGMPLGPVMGITYLLIAALYIYPLIKGFQFANGTKAACLQNDQFQLARAAAGLKDLLKFTGILTIIVVSIYVVALIFIMLFAALGIAAMS